MQREFVSALTTFIKDGIVLLANAQSATQEPLENAEIAALDTLGAVGMPLRNAWIGRSRLLSSVPDINRETMPNSFPG